MIQIKNNRGFMKKMYTSQEIKKLSGDLIAKKAQEIKDDLEKIKIQVQ